MERYRLQKYSGERIFHNFGYETLAGNASLEDARIVIIAESHYHVQTRKNLFGRCLELTWSDSREKVQDLLAHYTKAGDILLRESYQLGKQYPWQKAHDELGVSQGVFIFGWDNMRLVKKTRKWVRRLRKVRYLHHDVQKEKEFDRKAHEYAMQRNIFLHKAIIEMERTMGDENTLYVVAGSDHILGNTELLAILQEYSFTVIEAKTRQELQKRAGLQGFP